MQVVSIEQIDVSYRVRKLFTERRLEELKASILSKGLMHPIVVEQQDNGLLRLIAGERRYRTVQMMQEDDVGFKCNGVVVPVGMIPVTYLTDLDEDTRLEAELEENAIREDLTLQERAAGYKRLHDLRVKQKGEFDHSTGVGQTLADTAREIHGDEITSGDKKDLSDMLIIAQHLDDPIVAAAKNKGEALKAIKDVNLARQRKVLAEQFNLNDSPHEIYLGDSYANGSDDHVPFVTPKSIDVVIADPPYGRDIHKESSHPEGRQHNYDDSEEALQEAILRLPELLWNVTKDQAHVWVFCDIRKFDAWMSALIVAGFDVWPRPIIWDKGNTGSYGAMEYGFRQTYETIVFANKGRRKMVKAGNEVISISNPTGQQHAAAKPVALYVDILTRSALPTNTVFDPYAGRGTIFEAATDCKCHAIGVEKNPANYDLCIESLAKLVGKKHG